MTEPTAQQIIPGITLDGSGRATVDGPMGKRLIELAIQLESYTPHPVDVQHVLAAIIIAARRGQLAATQPLPPADAPFCRLLAQHIDALFARHGGRVAPED